MRINRMVQKQLSRCDATSQAEPHQRFAGGKLRQPAANIGSIIRPTTPKELRLKAQGSILLERRALNVRTNSSSAARSNGKEVFPQTLPEPMKDARVIWILAEAALPGRGA